MAEKRRHKNMYYSEARSLRRIIPLPFEPSQSQLLTDEKMIQKWSTFTIDQRVTLANKMFENQCQISKKSLREMYALQNVKLRATAIKPALTIKQQRAINEQSLIRNEHLIQAIKARREIVFIDEAVFSKRSIIDKIWRKPYHDNSIIKAKYSFKAIGAVAAINTAGKVIGCVIRQGSINLDALCDLMRKIKSFYGRRRVTIFLDNLRMHYNAQFKELVQQHGHELIYNASYQSHLNPIERLWAVAKRSFGRLLVQDSDMRSQAEVEGFVIRSIVTSSEYTLRRKVVDCCQQMLNFKRLVDLQLNNSQNMVDAEMTAQKKEKKSGSAGRSPSKDLHQNRPGAQTPSKAAIQNIFQPGQITGNSQVQHRNKQENFGTFGGSFVGVSHDEAPIKIHVEDIVDLTSSKSSMYRALALYGQIFLPPKNQCTIEFLKQLLTGNKLYFLNHAVPYVYVQKLERLTVKNVLDKVYKIPEVRKYLPDYADHADRYMNRDFLFSIVNKLDPTFFKRVQQEVGDRRKAKAEEIKPATIQVKPDLLAILREAQAQQRTRESQGDQRALKSMLTTNKKRKRRDRENIDEGLKTEFQPQRMKL